MSEFKPGEIVDIAIKGVRIKQPDVGQTRHIRVIDEHGNEYPMPPQAAITRVAPAEWPPQEKDVWKDRDGDHWYGLLVDDDDTTDGPYVALMAGRNSKRTGADEGEILYWHGPLTLVRREQDEPPPYADDHYLSCMDPACSCKADGGVTE